MKIKDLLNFNAFRGADFVDCTTYKRILDQEKEIEDIHSIQTNEKVEYIGSECKYPALHRWLTVCLLLKED